MLEVVKAFGVFAVLSMLLVVPFASADEKSSEEESPVYMKTCDGFDTCEDAALEIESGSEVGASGSETYNGKPVVTPWWVDMVDAEPSDIDIDDGPVYIAVLDTGLIPAYTSCLPTEKLDLTHAKAFTVDWTWNSEVGDFEAGDVYEKTVNRFNPGWKGYITEPCNSGHGTGVASVITGYRRTIPDLTVDPPVNKEHYIRGINPNAKVIPVMVLDGWLLDCPDSSYPGYAGGKILMRTGTPGMIAAGIEYIADLKEDLDAPVVISMSIGNPDKPTDMSVRNAIEYAIEKGCIVVASAGNNGDSGMVWPAAFPEVISCGAAGWTETYYVGSSYSETFWRTDIKDVPEKLNTKDAWKNNKQIYLEEFSSRPNKDLGQKKTHLDVSCVGANLLVPYKNPAYWTGTKWELPGWGWFWIGGTSFSAPCVAAIASLVLENYPDAEQDEIEWILSKGATGESLPSDGAWVSDYGWNTNGLSWHKWYGSDYGAGFLTADTALDKADAYF